MRINTCRSGFSRDSTSRTGDSRLKPLLQPLLRPLPQRAAGFGRHQRGIALIVVLWLTILLTVIGSGFAFSMRSEALSARNALSLAQVRAVADGAIERVAFELQRPRTLADAWAGDDEPHTWTDGEVTIVARAVDESAKIDLNMAPEPLLKGLLTAVGGLDPDAAQKLVDAIADWRDPDDLRRPNGAEEAEYRAAGRSYRPPNASFETVGELQRVLGMTPELFARVNGALTVYSNRPGINPATASRDVLLALPGVTAEVVDTFLAQRQEARQNKLPVPPFPQAAGLGGGAIPVWRIHAEARLPDGVTFIRDAVLRPSAEPRRPLIAYLWQEGTLVPPPEPNAGAAAPAPPAHGTGNL
jgi:general secretion pathway protein K